MWKDTERTLPRDIFNMVKSHCAPNIQIWLAVLQGNIDALRCTMYTKPTIASLEADLQCGLEVKDGRPLIPNIPGCVLWWHKYRGFFKVCELVECKQPQGLEASFVLSYRFRMLVGVRRREKPCQDSNTYVCAQCTCLLLAQLITQKTSQSPQAFPLCTA